MPKNLQTLFVILKRLRGGRLLTLELHSESWVLDRITFPDDVLLSMHHKKLPSTRFQLQCFLFQGLTDSGIYYHCHHPRWHAVSYYLVCVRGLLSWSELDGDGSVSVSLASLYSLPFWLSGQHPWVPPPPVAKWT
jgi:hypothetical protein